MRRVLPLLFLLLLAGCIRRAELVQAPAPTAVAAVFLFDQEEESAVLPAPESLVRASTSVLQGHNLLAEALPAEEWAEAFSSLRSTRQRMLHLLEATGQDVVLLVETRARFGTLIEGRYRWTVPVQLTLARRGAEDFPVQATVEVPVFLRFAHERGLEAVEAAGPTITRRLSRMADELLREGATVGARRRKAAPKATVIRRAPEAADAIYFVLVDRHRNGDPSNDVQVDPADPQAFHGGDLRGVIDDVDRLAGMGFRSLWLSPVWGTRDEHIGPWGAFHGYWVEDPGTVDPRFGTADELAELSDALRARGMGLILDVVTNHVAPGSPLLAQHPDWFHSNGDIVDWQDAEQVVVNDVHGLPDLAQEKEEVRDWLVGHGQDWVRRVRPEGFRLDAVRHVGLDFWADYNRSMRAVGGEDLTLIGELFDGDPATVARYWEDGGFGGMFDFPLHYALMDVFCADEPVGRLAAVLAQDRQHPDPSQLVTFLDNHDLPRVASRCAVDAEDQAIRVLFSLRGRPAITWGTEAGLDGAEEPANRADFPWGAERRWEKTLVSAMKLRAAHGALRSKDREVLALGEGRLALLQRAEGAAIIAINRTEQPWELALPSGEWRDSVRRAVLGDVLLVPARAALVVTGRTDRARLRSVDTDLSLRLEGLSLVHGDEVILVGSGPELGNWDPASGIPTDPDGTGFVVSASLPAGHVLEYKFVVRRADGEITWEDRPNRYLLVNPERREVTATWNA